MEGHNRVLLYCIKANGFHIVFAFSSAIQKKTEPISTWASFKQGENILSPKAGNSECTRNASSL
jgi:hypothetical protein